MEDADINDVHSTCTLRRIMFTITNYWCHSDLLPRGHPLVLDGIGAKVQVRASPLGGVGVFATDTLLPKEIATEYGGGPEWTAKEDTEYPRGSATYVFRCGPFRVRCCSRGSTVRQRRYLEWDGRREKPSTRTSRCGHLVNTSHPSLPAPADCLNCVFGVYVDTLVPSARTVPSARLFIVCARPIEKGEELLVDYHYMLAYESGFWCLNESCQFCMSGIVCWVDEVARPRVERQAAGISKSRRRRTVY
jgi:hypothetical protein